MEISVDRPGKGQVVIRPSGKVDAETSSRLKDEFRTISDELPEVVIVDLAAVDFLDSSGLSALVSGLKTLRGKGGQLRLSGPRPQALTALRLTMLHRVFPIFDTVEAALQSG